VAQLYPRALGSLLVASYDSQGCGGGILTRLQTDANQSAIQLIESSFVLLVTSLHGQYRKHRSSFVVYGKSPVYDYVEVSNIKVEKNLFTPLCKVRFVMN
jgi:hypothetical protein